MYRFISLLLSVNSFLIIIGQTKAQKVRSAEISLHYGTIFAHSQEVQNTSGARPRGIAIAWLKTDTSLQTYNTCRCALTSGFNFTFFDYNNPILDKGLSLNYQFEPKFRIGLNQYFLTKTQFGLTYQTNPYHEDINPSNMSYSLPVSFYGALAVGYGVLINKKHQFKVYANYLHTSNGGIKDPNKGVNWPTVSIGYNHYLQPLVQTNYNKNMFKIKRKSSIYLFGFASSKTIAVGEKTRYVLGGLSIQYQKPLNSLFALATNTDLYQDYSLAKRLEKDKLNLSSVRGGSSGGYALMLGKFNFSQQIGVYWFNQTPYFSNMYHRHQLTYTASPKWVVGISLKAHAHVSNFMDFRIGYKLK